MFDPLTNRVLIILGASFIGLNCFFGYLHCQDNFCPGDNQNDYIYEYVTDNGTETNGETRVVKELTTPYEIFMSKQIPAPKENHGIRK